MSNTWMSHVTYTWVPIQNNHIAHEDGGRGCIWADSMGLGKTLQANVWMIRVTCMNDSCCTRACATSHMIQWSIIQVVAYTWMSHPWRHTWISNPWFMLHVTHESVIHDVTHEYELNDSCCTRACTTSHMNEYTWISTREWAIAHTWMSHRSFFIGLFCKRNL